ncbi:PAS domain-containing protein [Spirosoma aerophilum]
MNDTTTLATPSVTLLTSLLENSPYGVIAYEAVRDNAGLIIDYRTIYYNQRVLAITGHTHEEMTKQWLFERAPYARAQTENFRRVVEEQITFDIQQLVPTLNRWFAFEDRPLENGFFTTIRDIDDLKRTELALEQQNIALREGARHTREQRLLLSSVLDTSLNSITVEKAIRNETDQIIDFRVTLMNKAALALGGYTEEYILSRPVSQLNPLFNSSGLLAEYCTVLETGLPFSADFFVQPLNKHLSLLVTKMDDDHVIVFFTDITQNQLDAKVLQQKNELLDGILRTSESAIMVCEAVHDDAGQLIDFRIILTNEAAVRIGGRSGQDITGRLLSTINP